MTSATRASSDTAFEDFCRRRGKQSKACRALWPVIAATVAQPQASDKASLPSSKKDSSDYLADFCQRRGQQSKVCRAQRRAIKVAKKWEQASPSKQPTQRAGLELRLPVMQQKSVEAPSRGQIPRHFIITDKTWSERADKLNRSLALTHPGWPVHFYDDATAGVFIRQHYPDTSYASIFRQFKVNAHRADFFRYAALHAKGGYYVDADNRPIINLEAATRGFDFVTALHGSQIHNGFLAARPGSGLMSRMMLDMADKVRRSNMGLYYYFVRSGLKVIGSAISRDQGRLRAHRPYTAAAYNGSHPERVLLLSHETARARHPNHTRAALWACGLNRTKERPGAPRSDKWAKAGDCECLMHVGIHPTSY